MPWAYRAGAALANGADTQNLLNDFGFLWRSLHNVDGNHIANVLHVAIGDIIYVYYNQGGLNYIGAYIVLEPEHPAAPHNNAELVPDGTALDNEIDGYLNDDGGQAYEHDSVLNGYTGFRLEEIDAPQPNPYPVFGMGSLIQV